MSKQDLTYTPEDGEISLEQKIKKLKKKLKQCQKEKEEYLAGWQRAQADLINYKRRQEEQMCQWAQTANQELICQLLPALDSLNAAASHHPKEPGLVRIKEQLEQILKEHGLKEIETLGQKFNPELHEVVEIIEGANEDEIIEEVQKGYRLKENIIRPAKVKISKLRNT